MQRDAACTIVEPTRGDGQRAWGMGLLWQPKGAHMTSKPREVSGGVRGGKGKRKKSMCGYSYCVFR